MAHAALLTKMKKFSSYLYAGMLLHAIARALCLAVLSFRIALLYKKHLLLFIGRFLTVFCTLLTNQGSGFVFHTAR
jgi:hypothetical protein